MINSVKTASKVVVGLLLALEVQVASRVASLGLGDLGRRLLSLLADTEVAGVDSHRQTPIRFSSEFLISSYNTATDGILLNRQFFSGGFGGFGMGGRPSMFDSDDDDDMGGSSFGGFGNRSYRSNARQTNSTQSKPSEVTLPLKVSLEELYNGTTKHLKVGRRLLSGAKEDKVLEIQISPGWKSGTKIRFPKSGNEQPNGDSQNLVFIVEEKQHERFTREGNDLTVNMPISLVDALTGSGGKKVVEGLDGRKLQVSVPSGVVKPGLRTTLTGEGMPIRKDGSVKKRGDLIVKWDAVFPTRLSEAQKEGLRKVFS